MSKIKNWRKIDYGIWQNGKRGSKDLLTLWIGSFDFVNLSHGKFRTMPIYYENKTVLKKCINFIIAKKFAVNWMKAHPRG